MSRDVKLTRRSSFIVKGGKEREKQRYEGYKGFHAIFTLLPWLDLIFWLKTGLPLMCMGPMPMCVAPPSFACGVQLVPTLAHRLPHHHLRFVWACSSHGSKATRRLPFRGTGPCYMCLGASIRSDTNSLDLLLLWRLFAWTTAVPSHQVAVFRSPPDAVVRCSQLLPTPFHMNG